jgi:hypothetical protein
MQDKHVFSHQKYSIACFAIKSFLPITTARHNLPIVENIRESSGKLSHCFSGSDGQLAM